MAASRDQALRAQQLAQVHLQRQLAQQAREIQNVAHPHPQSVQQVKRQPVGSHVSGGATRAIYPQMYNRPGSGGVGNVPVGTSLTRQQQMVQQIQRQQKTQQEHQYVNEFVQQYAARKEAVMHQQQNTQKQLPQQNKQGFQQQGQKAGGIPEEPLSPPSGFKNNNSKPGQGKVSTLFMAFGLTNLAQGCEYQQYFSLTSYKKY